MIVFLSCFFAGLYIAVTKFLSSGIRKVDLRRTIDVLSGHKPTVAVIVAARNEVNNLPILLRSLQTQSYPADLFTITIVNDRSEDNTVQVVHDFQKIMPNLKLILVETVPDGIAPKKNAISMGISQSSGEIILVTDADCVVHNDWISEIAARFTDPNIGLVQGLTLYPYQSSIFHRFQRLDFFSHSVVAAAAIGSGVPINSNANNFAYRRILFESLKGFEGCSHIVSGDDDLLLQKVWEQGKWKISYLFTLSAAVQTVPTQSLRDFFEQRKRWGSKTVFYKPLQVLLLLIIFLYYCWTAFLTILLITPFREPTVLLAMYGVKIIGELFFLIPGTAVFSVKEMRKDILWASPIQLWIVLASVLFGVFGGFTWKGSFYKKSLNKIEQ